MLATVDRQRGRGDVATMEPACVAIFWGDGRPSANSRRCPGPACRYPGEQPAVTAATGSPPFLRRARDHEGLGGWIGCNRRIERRACRVPVSRRQGLTAPPHVCIRGRGAERRMMTDSQVRRQAAPAT